MPTRPWGEALAAAQRAFCLPLAGDTRRQVLQVLGGGGGGRGAAADAANVASRVVKRVLKDRSTSGGPRLAFTGGIWADTSTSLSPGFVEAVRSVYSSTARTADFINKVWHIVSFPLVRHAY
jgi:serpin B